MMVWSFRVSREAQLLLLGASQIDPINYMPRLKQWIWSGFAHMISTGHTYHIPPHVLKHAGLLPGHAGFVSERHAGSVHLQ